MLIVDGQIYLWEKGTPSPQHRQEPYSAEQAIAAMDEAGVDRALVHPVLWDPDFNELAIEAVRKYPDRFAIMGWFYLDDPNGRDLVAHWKERPGMLGLRFYFNERHKREWMTDGSLDWLWPAAEQAGVPVALAAALFLPTVGQIAERHPGLKLIVDHMAVPPGSQGDIRLSLPARAAGARQIPQRRGQGDRSARLRGRRLSVPQLPRAPAPLLRRVRPGPDVLGHRHHPDALFLAAMRDGVHRGTAVAEGPRPRPGHGRSALQLGRLAPSRLRAAIGNGAQYEEFCTEEGDAYLWAIGFIDCACAT